jgi:hypothetical protein
MSIDDWKRTTTSQSLKKLLFAQSQKTDILQQEPEKFNLYFALQKKQKNE